MKRICLCLLALFLLCGCTSKGSFQDGDKNVDQFIQEVNKQIEKRQWSMALINERSMSKQAIENAYQLDMTRFEEVNIYSSIVSAQVGEIAFFRCAKSEDKHIQEGIQYRLHTLKSQWTSYIQDANTLFDNAKQGRIGQYYYFVLGVDSKKVVNYIQNEK